MLRRAVLLALAALAVPAAAPARIVEVGQIENAPPPSCPATPCLAVSRTTGYQAKFGPTRGILTVPEDGKIVAWTITLGTPGPRQVEFFDDMLGGESVARLTVLRPGGRLFARVTGQSPLQKLAPYFGQTVQFPLGRTLNVRKGYVVALTVPTWAPALAVGLGNDTSWRASRAQGRCEDTQRQSALQSLAAIAQFRCLYRTARLTYSATLVTRPVPPGTGAGRAPAAP